MSMGRITKMQQEIAGLQAVLQERNKQIAGHNAELAARDRKIKELEQRILELSAPKAA